MAAPIASTCTQKTPGPPVKRSSASICSMPGENRPSIHPVNGPPWPGPKPSRGSRKRMCRMMCTRRRDSTIPRRNSSTSIGWWWRSTPGTGSRSPSASHPAPRAPASWPWLGLRHGLSALARAEEQDGDRQDQRDDPDHEEYSVGSDAHPLERVERPAHQEGEPPGVPVAVLEHVPQLQDARRKEIDRHHEREPRVQPPEAHPDPALSAGPCRIFGQKTQAEDEHGQREHPEDAEERPVGVVVRQRGADLEVGNDREVDQATEDPLSLIH